MQEHPELWQNKLLKEFSKKPNKKNPNAVRISILPAFIDNKEGMLVEPRTPNVTIINNKIIIID